HKLVDIHHTDVNAPSQRSVTTECETGPFTGQTLALSQGFGKVVVEGCLYRWVDMEVGDHVGC
ncbi:hypothetical protein, partial [Streptomyces sp. NPDC002537]